MNLDELQSARDRERQTDKLQQLRESFYEDAGEFIQQLQTERERAAERAENPFDSPQVKQLTDEINTAEQTVEAIYEKRIGKLVKAASLDAAGLPSEADGLTAEEQDLFDALVTDIKSHRNRVLDVIDGVTPSSQTESNDAEPAASPGSNGVSAADVMGGGSELSEQERRDGDLSHEEGRDEPKIATSQESSGSETATPAGTAGSETTPAKPAENQTPPEQHHPPEQFEPVEPEIREAPNTEQPVRNDGGLDTTSAKAPEATATGEEAGSGDVHRSTILVTDDVDTFMGFDGRDYDLASNDVVTLPSTNADLLVERDVARPLD